MFAADYSVHLCIYTYIYQKYLYSIFIVELTDDISGPKLTATKSPKSPVAAPGCQIGRCKACDNRSLARPPPPASEAIWQAGNS